MKHSFHGSLIRSFSWYHNWHEHPRHQHTHWVLLVAILLIVFSFLTGEIGNFYLENEYQAQAQASLTLGISGDRFTLNGTPTFLLMVSYFDAMGASDATLDSDFVRLRSLGFTGIRIFPDWPWSPTVSTLDHQLLDINGNFNPGMLARLTNILQKAQNNGMIVDITFDRGLVPGRSAGAMINGIRNTAQAISSYRNVYFDLTNEADYLGDITCGSSRLCPAEARQARDAVKAVDPQRIVSISVTSGNYQDYIINGGMDFALPHRSFGPLTGTAGFITQEKSAAPGLPVHLQEPARCRQNPCEYPVNEYLDSARDTKCVGGAGWNFHTSGGYNLTGNTLFNQFLDPGVETAVANGLGNALSGTVWGSCSPNPPPPPPQVLTSGCPSSAPVGGGPPFGSRGPCPAGFIVLGEANASIGDPSATTGYFCDDDLPAGATQVTYPVSGTLYCSGSGTAFITDSGPCNCRPTVNTVTCAFDPANPTVGRQGWFFDSNGQPIGVNLMATTTNCSSGQAVTLNNGSFSVGAWHNSLSGSGYVCIPGTDLSQVAPRTIYYVFPNTAVTGTDIIISGENLGTTVNFINSSRVITTATGTFDTSCGTELTVTVPAGLTPGQYTISVGSNPGSNEASFEVLPAVTGTQPPVITSINPVVVNQGDTIEIMGEFLSSVVRLTDINGAVIGILGGVSSDFKITTVAIPITLAPGVYTVSVTNPNGTTASPDVLTVLSGQLPITAAAAPPVTPAATDFQDLISSAFNYSIILVGIAVFIMIMWGGFLWLTSAANPSNISRAKGIIFNAILGAVLLVSAYVILYTINPELVGGTFTLKGIQPGQPTQPVPPPGRGPPGQAEAQALLNLMTPSSFSINATCGSNFHARQNIQDTAAGIYPAVCSSILNSNPPPTYVCNGCAAGGPSGNVHISTTIFSALTDLWNQGLRFKVTSFTTGAHKPTSLHYQGRAIDIQVIFADGSLADPSLWRQARNFLDPYGNAFCEEGDGDINLDCDPIGSGPNSVNHIHANF